MNDTENIRYRQIRLPSTSEIGVLASRPPLEISPISAAMPAPMMMPPFIELGTRRTITLPRRVRPSTRKMRNTRNCRTNSAWMASGPGLNWPRNSSTTGMPGVIQPGTSGTPSSAGSMKPTPQTTT
ncbi:hypothetical protein D3C86_1803070 [compost metagenome]